VISICCPGRASAGNSAVTETVGITAASFTNVNDGSVTAVTKEIAPDSPPPPPPLKGSEVERPDGGPLKPLRPSASEIITDRPTRSGRAINIDPNKDRPPGSNKN
jgi:hypothetical protein